VYFTFLFLLSRLPEISLLLLWRGTWLLTKGVGSILTPHGSENSTITTRTRPQTMGTMRTSQPNYQSNHHTDRQDCVDSYMIGKSVVDMIGFSVILDKAKHNLRE